MLYLVGGLEHVLFFHILGMSSSQLTNSYFSEGGRYTTNQSWVIMGLRIFSEYIIHLTAIIYICSD